MPYMALWLPKDMGVKRKALEFPKLQIPGHLKALYALQVPMCWTMAGLREAE